MLQVRWPEDVRERIHRPPHYKRPSYDTDGTDSHTIGSIDSSTTGSPHMYGSGSTDTDKDTDTSISPARTTIRLRSSRMSATCGGENFRKDAYRTEFIHDQDKACIEGQGRRSDERFAWRCSGGEEEQADLMERFSKSRHLGELHKHQTGDKKGQYMDFHSEEFWKKFHEARQKAEEEASTTGSPMPDDLQLMATIFGGLSHSRLYAAGLEATHLRIENSRAVAGLPPCCFKVEQRIMRRVEAASSVCASFDEHMRRFAEQSYLLYTPIPPMMDIIRTVIVVVPSISLSTAEAAGISDARVSSCTPPHPLY
ncbi:hypothetical protein M9H77_09409 [Catharanthus roseus]|uniref:Uncharacterized protein n=1 Tax=Catharanthus roseus TaxID=4058 RepID=A0ACC0C0R1_CATRO|nr:hypothetical protein M9H77_09409 [Catharanthus roseus]